MWYCGLFHQKFPYFFRNLLYYHEVNSLPHFSTKAINTSNTFLVYTHQKTSKVHKPHC